MSVKIHYITFFKKFQNKFLKLVKHYQRGTKFNKQKIDKQKLKEKKHFHYHDHAKQAINIKNNQKK